MSKGAEAAAITLSIIGKSNTTKLGHAITDYI
jgi:hypothetical protein